MATPRVADHAAKVTVGQSVSATVTAAAGDTLVAVESCDDTGQFTGPSPGSWQKVVETRGPGGGHVNLVVHTRKVSSAGSYKVIGNLDAGGYTHGLVLLAVAGLDQVEASKGAGGASGKSQAAASVSPQGSDDLLLTAWTGEQFNGSLSFTPPASMTLADRATGADGYMGIMAAAEALTAGGATGTRTATSNVSAGYGWAALSLALKGAATAEHHSLSATLGLGLGATAGQTKRARLAAQAPLVLDTTARVAKHARKQVTASLGIALDVAATQTKRARMGARGGLTFGVLARARKLVTRRDIDVQAGPPTLGYSVTGPTTREDTAGAPSLGDWQAGPPTLGYSVTEPYVQR
jgi:hypothetical protein